MKAAARCINVTPVFVFAAVWESCSFLIVAGVDTVSTYTAGQPPASCTGCLANRVVKDGAILRAFLVRLNAGFTLTAFLTWAPVIISATAIFTPIDFAISFWLVVAAAWRFWTALCITVC